MEGYSLLRFKEVFSRWDSAFANDGWLSIYLANHDQARMVTRFGNDDPVFRDLSSKILTTFILSMRGTAYYYNGDELGMTNAGFDKIEDYKDMPTLHEYQDQKKKGGELNKFMQHIKFESRDNSRTPFQWNTTTHAGFTSGTPWIKVKYKTLNDTAQKKDPNSCLNYFRSLVKLRKANPVLVYGKYTLLDKNNPKVYAYTREDAGRKLLIVLNFSTTASEANPGINVANAKLLLNNYQDAPVKNISQTVIRLRPYEALIYQFKDILFASLPLCG
jgi:oligo-1,6-glucosidase